jgi:CubicO group peptidase (beta-lactamase class C family)
MAAFNRPGSLQDYIAANFAQASLTRESAASRAAPLDRLKANSGGLSSVKLLQQSERAIEMIVVTRDGSKFAKLVMFTSGKEPGKVSNLFILPARDPQRAADDAFPDNPVSDAEIVRLVNRRLDRLAEEDGFSGTVLIAHRDRVILREARGMADAVWQVPNRITTRFNIASVGKMWTATLLLKLAEQGRLSLDDPLARWVPAFPYREAAQKITLRMLLQHHGGLAEWDGRTAGPLTPSAAAATMHAPAAMAGTAFSYSNAGYVLLAAAAEAASGEKFDQLVQRLVFEPAGMASSGYWPVTAVVPDRATGYLRPADDPLGFGPKFSNEQFLGFVGDASGGGYSTVDDMLAFHRALANGRLLSPAGAASMVARSVEFPGAPRPSRYGLGLRLTDCAGAPTLGHGGGGPNSGVSASSYASLSGEWTIIVLGNMDPPAPEDLAFEICELVHRS